MARNIIIVNATQVVTSESNPQGVLSVVSGYPKIFDSFNYKGDIEAGDSGSIFYLHDAPELANSNTVWKMTADAWAVTNDYKGSDTIWNGGMTVDGTMIAKVLSTIGLNFDWGTGGTLTLGGQDNKNGEMRILDASGSETGRFNNVGINMNGGKFTVDDKGNVQAMSITAYGSLICYEHYTIT